jgi:hypothetical protein
MHKYRLRIIQIISCHWLAFMYANSGNYSAGWEKAYFLGNMRYYLFWGAHRSWGGQAEGEAPGNVMSWC